MLKPFPNRPVTDLQKRILRKIFGKDLIDEEDFDEEAFFKSIGLSPKSSCRDVGLFLKNLKKFKGTHF